MIDTLHTDCLYDQPHQFHLTNRGYYCWTDTNTTNPEQRPDDAPFFREERCLICGLLRYISDLRVESVTQYSLTNHTQSLILSPCNQSLS